MVDCIKCAHLRYRGEDAYCNVDECFINPSKLRNGLCRLFKYMEVDRDCRTCKNFDPSEGCLSLPIGIKSLSIEDGKCDEYESLSGTDPEMIGYKMKSEYWRMGQ